MLPIKNLPYLPIKTELDLKLLIRNGGLFSDWPVSLQLSQLDARENQATSEKINQLKHECGCSLGAAALLAGFVLSLGTFIFADGLFSWSFLWHIPLVLLIAFLSAGAGKGLGILLARAQSLLIVLRLIRKLDYSAAGKRQIYG